MDITTKTEIINDLANDVPQSEIARRNDCSQQNISYLLKTNKLEVEKLRNILITKLSRSMVNRAVKEARKADRIVNYYDDETLDIPDKSQSEYLRLHDSKVTGLIKGIVAPTTSDTNINVSKTESITNINSNVLRMFHNGAKALIDNIADG
jgi:transcriptional regulator